MKNQESADATADSDDAAATGASDATAATDASAGAGDGPSIDGADSALSEPALSEPAPPEPAAPEPASPNPASPDPVGSGTDSVVDLQERFDTLNDRHLRLVAEFNNFKRRSEQERLAAWGRAQADLVERFLDVLDDLHRVADLDLSNATVEAIMEGVDLVERKFVRTISDAGIKTIDPAGEAFDPEHMEAMMRVPAEADQQVDTVAQVFQKGYSLKDILVRPARVSVYTQG